MPVQPADHAKLMRCLVLAQQSIGLSDPNPRVGCVLHDAKGTFAGEGCTQHAGGPHAEVMALRDARTRGVDLRGGTAWVSLEPCAHHGRTPPCCDALIDAGLARVVVATSDPFPQVAGQGLARLQAAGIDVVVAEGDVALAARELNIGFFSRVIRSRPWVRMKLAASLDGRTALPNGASQWITGPPARLDGQRWRQRAGAVLTGIGTVLADNPRLDVRDIPTTLQPLRVVLDSRWRTPLDARILRPPGDVLVVGARPDASRQIALHAAGARTWHPPDVSVANTVAPEVVLTMLAGLGVNELHVEAGPTLSGAWLANRAVDELVLYLAPRLLGPGRPLADLPELDALDQAIGLQMVDAQSVGNDLRIRLRREGSDSFIR
jgi:diaminohydroxyphosphoribosylaminopyrimidine deaminase/5-amino-6-(5-phosphoribosylamino)uracil reductase